MAAKIFKPLALMRLLGFVALGLGVSAAALAEFKEVMVPMRDGVKLATNVFLPAGDGPWPVVLTRTPYNKGPAKDREAQEAPYTNKVYPIKVNLWSTALAFNKGHKIAIHVMSSNAPRFEPHSNTWEPLASYD
ncbi:MAG: hypothetical protein HY288_13215 [Planctomycetia bacterium]|nr:hypothetical protein [Planctomycetia bacterium]